LCWINFPARCPVTMSGQYVDINTVNCRNITSFQLAISVQEVRA
jgi:hypothetical protein